jgi:hypothetical protein
VPSAKLAGLPSIIWSETWQGIGCQPRVSETTLCQLATHHGLVVDRDLAAGWYPLPPRAARVVARFDRRHGAFLVQRYVKSH